MIRDFTKSAISFSWALSLLSVRQAANLLKPAQQQGSNLLAPMIQVAVDQLDDSMKNIYRSGDSLQARAVDLAFSWVNPAQWINPSSWTRPFAPGCGQQPSSRDTNGNGFTGSAQNSGRTPVDPSGSAPVSNDTAAVGWGPMPSDS